ELVLERFEQALADRAPEEHVIVVPAGELVFLQKRVVLRALAEDIELIEHGERRQTRKARVLRGIEQHGAHLARARSDASLVNRVSVALVIEVGDGGPQELAGLVL